MIRKNIKKEHLEKAIAEIDKDGIRKGRHSSTYDLIHNGKTYPPKLVLSIANRYANGTELNSNDFEGGKNTPAFELMKAKGFEIVPKNDPIKSLIENYKKRIAETELKDEIYKWELVNEYRGRPNPESPDFYQEIKDVKFKNLIYAMGMAVINHLAKDKPEILRQLFINLFDETKDLTQRVKSFNKDTLKIYRELGETLQHHQDERSIATYLTFHDSEKYTFYKSSFYKKYCKLIGVKEAKKNEKYTHYLILIDELIENYIAPDNELIKQVKNLIPEYYNGTNHKLLAQDILFQMLDKKQETNYWIFQGNPKVFDFETALRDEILTDWTVSAHKDRIKVGDKVILWITGSNSGCYALAEVTAKPHAKTSSPDDHLWKGDDKSELKADIKITNNLVENPILKSDIESLEELNELKVGNQGTNFSATEDEYQTFLDLISSNNNSAYASVKNVLDSDLVNEYIFFLRNYVNQNQLQPEDDRISFNVRPNKKRLVFIIGSRYAFCIEKVKKKTEVSFISKDDLTNDSGSFTNQKKEIEAYWNRTTSISDFEDNIKEGFDIELARNNKNPFKRFTNKEFIEDIYQSKIIMGEKKNDTITSLNTILYGPPGTGKTFHTINEAIKIADPEFYKVHKNNREQLKARFKLLSLNNDNESVGQIGFTTFHQSFSYEDFIEGIKPNDPKEGDAFLKYEIQEGVFKKICRLADDSLNAVAVDTESLISLSREEYEKAHFYKMSLGNTQDENDNEIYEYCIENNCISIGFGNQLDFTGKDEKELRSFGNDNDLDSFSIQAMNLFSNYLKNGNYVVISYGNKYVRAVGKVTGDYEYRDDSELPNNLHYKHFRSVEWIFTDEKISANEIYNKNLSQQTIYKLDKKYIKQEFFVKEKKIDTHRLPKNPKNFVLIVDEINRGNVSSVFGELITLIEKDKRAGAEEELSVILPYSKETFSVPNNVYIIGTMNTADKSIEALDTALRRRFSFREMPPKHELIGTVGNLKSTNGKLGDIDVVKILKTINNRIEKLIDKDHKIGHSYFLNISSTQDLKDTFREKVIPLLEEYFFGDFGKISLVLGSSFILKDSADGVKFANSNDYDPSVANDLLERSVYEITGESSWDFKAIYE